MSITLLPEQIVVGPFAVITGMEGLAFTVAITPVRVAEVQVVDAFLAAA